MVVAQAPTPNEKSKPDTKRLVWGHGHFPLHQRSIRYVKGVGPGRAERLAELGIETVEDALWCAPRRYEDRTRLLPIRDAKPGETVTVRGTVLARTLRRIRGGKSIFEVAVGDASGVLPAPSIGRA